MQALSAGTAMQARLGHALINVRLAEWALEATCARAPKRVCGERSRRRLVAAGTIEAWRGQALVVVYVTLASGALVARLLAEISDFLADDTDFVELVLAGEA